MVGSDDRFGNIYDTKSEVEEWMGNKDMEKWAME